MLWCMWQETQDCNRVFRSVAGLQATTVDAHAGLVTTGRLHLQHARKRPTAGRPAPCGVMSSGGWGQRKCAPNFRPEPHLWRHEGVLPVCGGSNLTSSVLVEELRTPSNLCPHRPTACADGSKGTQFRWRATAAPPADVAASRWQAVSAEETNTPFYPRSILL